MFPTKRKMYGAATKTPPCRSLTGMEKEVEGRGGRGGGGMRRKRLTERQIVALKGKMPLINYSTRWKNERGKYGSRRRPFTTSDKLSS